MRNSLLPRLVSTIALTIGATASIASADPIPAKPPTTKNGKPYSTPTAAAIPVRPLWGNTHLHTVNSFDAGIMGTRVEPEYAFRLARGEQVVSTTGVPAKLLRPLDFLVVSDHSGYMGLPDALQSGAPENTRTAIFDALRRKEVYATTGPRITVRVFAGWDFKPVDAGRSDFAAFGYAHGVPMGGNLSAARKGQVPTLVIQAAKDPEGANLDRLQVIKGWVDTNGGTHEKVFEVAWSGDRKPGSDGKLPAVGNTVDAKTAGYSNSIGAAAFDGGWVDSTFDPAERAYYSIRVIEIPTSRWTTYDAVRFGGDLPKNLPASVTQRAYTSPIWYTPAGA